MGYRFHFPSAGLPTAKPVLPGLPSASIPARPVAACPPLVFRPVVRSVVPTRCSAPLFGLSSFRPVVRTCRSACHFGPSFGPAPGPLRPRPFSGHACGPVPAGPFPHPLRSRAVAIRRLSSFRQAPGLLTALSLHLRHCPFCIGPVIATFVAASTLSQHPSVAPPPLSPSGARARPGLNAQSAKPSVRHRLRPWYR